MGIVEAGVGAVNDRVFFAEGDIEVREQRT